jgi:hypothetical protein
MVSAISIFEAFEFVAFRTAFDYVTSAWTLCLLPCFTLVVDIAPSKWSPLGMGFILGVPLMIHHATPQPYLSLSILHPLVSLTFWIFGCIDPRRDCPSFHGKKGLKAQRGDNWKKKILIMKLPDAHPNRS